MIINIVLPQYDTNGDWNVTGITRQARLTEFGTTRKP